MVSSDFGKLEVSRHFVSGIACAMAGLATAVAASPAPAVCKKSRRFIRSIPLMLAKAGGAPGRGLLLAQIAGAGKPRMASQTLALQPLGARPEGENACERDEPGEWPHHPDRMQQRVAG